MRVLIVLVACVSSATTATGQTFLLEGEILSGTTLFTVNEPIRETDYGGLGFPEGGYPVSYAAIIDVEADDELWTFSFNATDAVETVLRGVDGPSTSNLGNRNEVLVTPSRLKIDFHRFSTFGTSFELDIDLSNETGSWSWGEFCPVCDLSHALPSAKASVTSVRVVPEPHSLLLCLGGLAVTASVARYRRSLR